MMGEENNCHVAVLLATYNGERHVAELLQSLLSQTYQNLVVLARDDGSSDRTLHILRQFSAQYPDQVQLVSDDLGNLRSLGNFARLMELCRAPYFTFCDQDDVWMPRKLEILMHEMQRAERQAGAATPILVHSDLAVVDTNLHEISPSFFRYSRVNLRKAEQLDRLLINNIVQGCASLGNRALLEQSLPIPPGVPFHDWWVALIAASCGVLRTVAEPTIFWRQHGGNQVGAGDRQRGATLWDARHVLRQPQLLRHRLTRAMSTFQTQANALRLAAGDKMPRRNRQLLEAFCLPQRQQEVALLPGPQRAWLTARFLIAYTKAIPLALRWCY